MTQRHAMRRGVAPRPSDKDVRAWRRLIVRARTIARDATGNGKPFVIAAEKAGKAIAPVGHQSSGDSPFFQLVRLGKRWLVMTVTDRLGEATTVKALADRCAEILDGEPGELTRTRKDIDG